MKVRFRGTIAADMYEVIEESPSFYIVNGVDGHCSLSKGNYEPVPTERWVDVTADVTVKDNTYYKGNPAVVPGGVFHGTHKLANLVCGGGYRLRKVNTGIGSTFLVERKEST